MNEIYDFDFQWQKKKKKEKRVEEEKENDESRENKNVSFFKAFEFEMAFVADNKNIFVVYKCTHRPTGRRLW